MQGQELLQIGRKEISPALRDDENIDIESLNRSCPVLNAAFNETLRMSAFSGSVRFVMDATNLGCKRLQPGSRLLHFDKEIFGKNADDFDPFRFLQNEQRTHASNIRPFGGGRTMCPGRVAARQSVMAFVARLLHKFDVEPLPGLSPHQPDLKTPVLSMAELRRKFEELPYRDFAICTVRVIVTVFSTWNTLCYALRRAYTDTCRFC